MFSSRKPCIVIVAGPTAVGKTAFSIKLARHFGAEIVNADSMQVYRYLNIGTAKPTQEELSLVKHHLINIVDPDEPFDAGCYKKVADEAIQDLWRKGIVPLVVGGTGLYMKVLTRGLCGTEEVMPAKYEIRRKLLEIMETQGLETLYKYLESVDFPLSLKIGPKDRQRILRALEVYELTGQPLSSLQERHGFTEEPYRSLRIFLYRERPEVYDRIDRRVLDMIDKGLCEEVYDVLSRGYNPRLKPLQAIGYRQIIRHIEGHLSMDDAIKEIQSETRHYAKRQFTWFKKERDFQWFHIKDELKVLKVIDHFLNTCS